MKGKINELCTKCLNEITHLRNTAKKDTYTVVYLALSFHHTWASFFFSLDKNCESGNESKHVLDNELWSLTRKKFLSEYLCYNNLGNLWFVKGKTWFEGFQGSTWQSAIFDFNRFEFLWFPFTNKLHLHLKLYQIEILSDFILHFHFIAF